MKRQRGESAVTLVVVVFVIALVAWQIYRGYTVNKIGIPDVLEIDLSPPPEQIRFVMREDDPNTDRRGGDYGNDFKTTLTDCENWCVHDAKCIAISYNTSSRQCWPKSAPSSRNSANGFVSAVKERAN